MSQMMGVFADLERAMIHERGDGLAFRGREQTARSWGRRSVEDSKGLVHHNANAAHALLHPRPRHRRPRSRRATEDTEKFAPPHVCLPGSGRSIVTAQLSVPKGSKGASRLQHGMLADVRDGGVKTGKARCEHMFSAVHSITDIAKILRHVRFVPATEVI